MMGMYMCYSHCRAKNFRLGYIRRRQEHEADKRLENNRQYKCRHLYIRSENVCRLVDTRNRSSQSASEAHSSISETGGSAGKFAAWRFASQPRVWAFTPDYSRY